MLTTTARNAVVLLALVLLSGCADKQSASRPDEPSYAPTPSGATTSLQVRPAVTDEPVSLHFAKDGRLVARPATVSFGKRQHPFLSALELAGEGSSDSGLKAVVPVDAFRAAGPDGSGDAASIGVQLRRDWYAHPLSRWDTATARLALRATICTLQSVNDSEGVPVEFYPPGFGPRLATVFGVAVPQPVNERMNVDCRD